MTSLVVRLAVACVAGLVAGTLASGGVNARERPRGNGASASYVSESLIGAPKRVGGFVLAETSYDPRMKEAGVGLHYEVAGIPGVVVDVFVYPAGNAPEERMLEDGMTGFRASFTAGVQRGYYQDLQLADTVAFEIAADDAKAATTTPAQPQTTATPATADTTPSKARESRIASLVDAAIAPKPIRGKRIDLRFRRWNEDTSELVPFRSRGYLFFRHMYYLKGRISVADMNMAQPDFESLSDRAMRELIPAIRIENVGACANMTVMLDKRSLEGEEDTMIDNLTDQILGQLVNGSERHCHASRKEAKKLFRDDVSVTTIEFEPGDWGSP